MFRWLYRHLPDCFEGVMIFKNIVIYTGGVFIGMLLGALFIAWLAKNGIRDKNLPAVKIMRIKKGSKTLYVSNTKDFSDTIHALFILVGWKLKLIRKNSVYYENAKVSKIAGLFILVLMGIVMFISLYWTFRIISVDGHIM